MLLRGRKQNWGFRRIPRSCERFFRNLVQALDRLITPERLRNYPMIFIVLGALMTAVSSAQRVIDPGAQGAFLPDYLAHWTGGGLLLSGEREGLYDPAIQLGHQVTALGPTAYLAWFVSPPLVAALCAPLSVLNYNVSAACWVVLSASMLIWCVHSLGFLAPNLMRRRRKYVFLAIFASAPVLELVGGGQDSAFVLAVWLVGLRLMATRRQGLAGAAIGLGVLKPQQVVLVPFVLLFTRKYRALAAFVAVVAGLSGVSVLLVGIDGVQHWVAAITSSVYTEQVQQGQAWKMVSLPAFIVAILPPGWSAWLAAYVGWAFIAIGFVFLLRRIRAASTTTVDTQAVWVATLATTVVFSPHLMIYDAILLVPVALFLLERRPSPFIRVMLVAAFVLMWLAPALHVLSLSVPWPFAAVSAPWASLPLTALWVESLKEVLTRRSPSPQSEMVNLDPGK